MRSLDLREVQVGLITALRVNEGKKQVNVFVDGSFSFTVNGEVAAIAGLKTGQRLSAEQIEELKHTDLFQSCFRAALYYLGYRPRSEAEVKNRLHRRGFSSEIVDKVVIRLKELRQIDDVAFAHYWRDNRLSFRPRSRRLIKLELRQKGVDTEIANEILGDLDDESAAYAAGLKKACLLSGLDYSEFRRRLSGYLRRRGFDYATVSSAVARLWLDRQTDSG